MSAHADLSFDGQNRFVMKGKRLPITLVNEGKEPALAEISLDWGTDGKGQALPFAVSRPLLRLAPASGPRWRCSTRARACPPTARPTCC